MYQHPRSGGGEDCTRNVSHDSVAADHHLILAERHAHPMPSHREHHTHLGHRHRGGQEALELLWPRPHHRRPCRDFKLVSGVCVDASQQPEHLLHRCQARGHVDATTVEERVPSRRDSFQQRLRCRRLDVINPALVPRRIDTFAESDGAARERERPGLCGEPPLKVPHRTVQLQHPSLIL